jgi:predicted transposase YbfD/YdcC
MVTIDAMGCQKDIAAKIVGGGGQYALAVKENQPHLYEDIERAFDEALDQGVSMTIPFFPPPPSPIG